MAKKKRKGKGADKAGRRHGASDGDGVRDRAIDAALKLAAGQGWRKTTLTAIAREAGVPLGALRVAFPSKPAIVDGLIQRVDQAALAAGPAEGSSARDRLFDVLMRRFDALDSHRGGVKAIVADLARDPLSALCHGPRLFDSMAWMLEAAGIGSSGPVGLLRTEGLCWVYLYALRAWLADDSTDRTHTMAALDRGLRQAEKAVNALKGLKAAKRSGRKGAKA
jgi:AcrR family transcriptional regulator